MKKSIIYILTLILAASCSINLYRPINYSVVDLDKTERDFLSSISTLSDTILTIKTNDLNLAGNYFLVIYQIKGQTKSQAFSESGNYPIKPIIKDFNWPWIFESLDSIKSQKSKPCMWGSIIDGDTIWHHYNSQNDWIQSELGNTIFKIYLTNDTISWKTKSSDRQCNPSMAKSKISKYIFSETLDKLELNEDNLIYGKRKFKKMPVIGPRN